MMKSKLMMAVLAFALGACASQQASVPEEEPVFTTSSKKNYVVLGDCAFTALQKRSGQITIARLDSRKTVQVARGDFGLIYWTLDIQDAGATGSSIVFRSARAVWGRDFYADQVRPSLEACMAG